MADDKSKSTVADAKAVEGSTKAEGITPFAKREPLPGSLLVKIYTPFKTFFEGDAASVTALNETGWFDVLPGHHNFITMLLACNIKVVDSNKQAQDIQIARGLMHIRKDKLIVFLDV